MFNKTMLALSLVALLGLAACETVKGVGKDVQKVGEKIEEVGKKK